MASSSVVDGVPFDPFVVMTREPQVLVGAATERLEAELCALSAHLDAALCRFLMMVGEYDRRQGWGEWEARSCAHWLAWKCGIALGTAREHVRVAHALETMALVREALASGVLSYSKVRAITRVCRPEIEAALIQVAKDSTATGLERICRAYRRHGEGTDADEAKRAHAERFVVWHYDDDGSLVIRGRVPAEHATTVIAMFETARTALEQPAKDEHDVPAGTPSNTETDDPNAQRQGNVPAGTRPVVREPLAARNADALVLAAEAFLANGPAGSVKGCS